MKEIRQTYDFPAMHLSNYENPSITFSICIFWSSRYRLELGLVSSIKDQPKWLFSREGGKICDLRRFLALPFPAATNMYDRR